jgi:hypothetical protein
VIQAKEIGRREGVHSKLGVAYPIGKKLAYFKRYLVSTHRYDGKWNAIRIGHEYLFCLLICLSSCGLGDVTIG